MTTSPVRRAIALILAAALTAVATYTVTAQNASGASQPSRPSTEVGITGPTGARAGPSAAQPEADGVSFGDVAEDAWYAPYVAHLARLRITTGYPDGTFRPDQPVTRAQMAVFLVRALNLEPVENPAGRFTDVPPNAWYAPHVERIAELRITIGCNASGTNYCPRNPVTRSQMALFLAQAFQLPAADVEEPTFEDADADHHAYEAIEAIKAANITVGCKTDPPRYCGPRPVIRAHMAAFLSRALEPRDQSAPSGLEDALPPGDASAGGCRQMFDATFVDGIASAHPGTRFTAAVHDHRTGCEYHLNPRSGDHHRERHQGPSPGRDPARSPGRGPSAQPVRGGRCRADDALQPQPAAHLKAVSAGRQRSGYGGTGRAFRDRRHEPHGAVWRGRCPPPRTGRGSWSSSSSGVDPSLRHRCRRPGSGCRA